MNPQTALEKFRNIFQPACITEHQRPAFPINGVIFQGLENDFRADPNGISHGDSHKGTVILHNNTSKIVKKWKEFYTRFPGQKKAPSACPMVGQHFSNILSKKEDNQRKKERIRVFKPNKFQTIDPDPSKILGKIHTA
jgi:hypothetical protein